MFQWLCLKSKTCTSKSTANRSSTDSTSPSRRDRSRPSWARTAPASRRSPMCSPARTTTMVTEGQVLFDGEDLLGLPPDERAAKGLFLAFQYPLEIPGVATMTFLRTALNAQRKKRGQEELSAPDFNRRAFDAAGKLGIDRDMLRRGVNVGFSGGEKKRNEVLQMALLGAEAGGARRDRLRPRHRRAQGRLRRRQPAALAGAVLRRHHPLSAAARLHRAGRGARAVARPHRAHRRQGTGAGARGQGLCAVQEEMAS